MSNPKPTIISHSPKAQPFTLFYRTEQAAIPGINLYCAPSKQNSSCNIPRKPAIYRPTTGR